MRSSQLVRTFARHVEANAALHCAERMPAPHSTREIKMTDTDYVIKQLRHIYAALKAGRPNDAMAYTRGSLLQLTGRLPDGTMFVPVVEIEAEPTRTGGTE
jgi:hypothetical protein